MTNAPEVLHDLLESRYSCRGFTPDPVPQETIESILDLARLTPSWCNTQPWHVIVTRGEGTAAFRKALTSGAQMQTDFDFPAAYTGVYRQRRRETAIALYESVGIEIEDRAASALQTAKNFELFGAPHAAVITTEADLGVYGAVDCGLYVQSFLLAAQAHGLGAIPQAALALFSPTIREHFGLPESRLVVCGISFGYADDHHPANNFRTTRIATGETVTWVE